MKLNVTVDGKTYAVDVEVEDDGRGLYPAHTPSHVSTPVPVASAVSATPTNGRAPAVGVDPAKLCHSPIAGIVIKVGIQVGQQLQANDLLMVLEAMKMETNVTAPVAGKVKDIYVRPGDGVTLGQVLVEFD